MAQSQSGSPAVNLRFANWQLPLSVLRFGGARDALLPCRWLNSEGLLGASLRCGSAGAGAISFWLSSDGAVHCSDCQEEATSMRGFWRIPERGEPQSSESLANVVFIFDGKRDQRS